VPNWIEHRHINRSARDDVVLFSVQDAPVMQALGLFRDELK
jgi:gentisate 1,2-dioxygenase